MQGYLSQASHHSQALLVDLARQLPVLLAHGSQVVELVPPKPQVCLRPAQVTSYKLPPGGKNTGQGVSPRRARCASIDHAPSPMLRSRLLQLSRLSCRTAAASSVDVPRRQAPSCCPVAGRTQAAGASTDSQGLGSGQGCSQRARLTRAVWWACMTSTCGNWALWQRISMASKPARTGSPRDHTRITSFPSPDRALMQTRTCCRSARLLTASSSRCSLVTRACAWSRHCCAPSWVRLAPWLYYKVECRDRGRGRCASIAAPGCAGSQAAVKAGCSAPKRLGGGGRLWVVMRATDQTLPEGCSRWAEAAGC